MEVSPSRLQRVCRGCAEGAWRMHTGCTEGCMEGVQRVCEGYMEGAQRDSGEVNP